MIRWNEQVWKRTQAVALWLLGAAGIANELFIVPKPRPEAWPIIGMLVGLPFAQAFDRARQQGTSDSSPPPAPEEAPTQEPAP
jgi:hypothetical protein